MKNQNKPQIKLCVSILALGLIFILACFHDVWTEEGKTYGIKYGIVAIPTQVFLDETGKEYYRHKGFFPEDELVKVLQQKGVKPI